MFSVAKSGFPVTFAAFCAATLNYRFMYVSEQPGKRDEFILPQIIYRVNATKDFIYISSKDSGSVALLSIYS